MDETGTDIIELEGEPGGGRIESAEEGRRGDSNDVDGEMHGERDSISGCGMKRKGSNVFGSG